MNREALAERSRRLREEIDRERREMAEAAATLERPMERAQLALRGLRRFRDDYALLLLPVVLLLILHRGGTRRMLIAAWTLISLLRRLRLLDRRLAGAVSRMAQRLPPAPQ